MYIITTLLAKGESPYEIWTPSTFECPYICSEDAGAWIRAFSSAPCGPAVDDRRLEPEPDGLEVHKPMISGVNFWPSLNRAARKAKLSRRRKKEARGKEEKTETKEDTAVTRQHR